MQYAMKSSEMSIKDFYCVFVRTEMYLIAFWGPSNCVNTQYAALSGAMYDRFSCLCTVCLKATDHSDLKVCIFSGLQ